MKTNYITINGTAYTESKKAMEAYTAPIVANDIDEAYSNPSYRKRRIWEKWAKEITGPIWIKGYNSSRFSIAGVTKDETSGKRYAVFITHLNNYAYELL